MLGGKGLECFIWSAAHDSDAEFLRRFAGDPERVAFMTTYHAADARAADAIDRLELLTAI